ncbi:FAD-dependent oxidoreductase, partial [Leuconostoc mesenteroides]
NQHSLLLASYNDMRTVNFWKSMIRSNDNKFIQHDEIKSKNNNLELFNEKYSDEVTNVMVEESINQLEELHDIKIPKPYASLVKDWSKDPFGGGYHAWHTGIDVQKTMKLIRKPYEYENIYIVGEAYSSDQGWTEGAFKTAEKMLQEHFGLERPEWLDSDYYLGW